MHKHPGLMALWQCLVRKMYCPGGGAVRIVMVILIHMSTGENLSWYWWTFMLCRKELLQCGVLNPEKDLYLCKLALTKHPKSPETWIHRWEESVNSFHIYLLFAHSKAALLKWCVSTIQNQNSGNIRRITSWDYNDYSMCKIGLFCVLIKAYGIKINVRN